MANELSKMSSKLQRLISHHEGERRTLTAAIEECVAEGDYGTARRLAKGLRRVARQLQMLLPLHDPLHGEKQMAAHRIEGLEKFCQSESGRVRAYFLEQLAAEKQKLAALEASVTEKSNAPPATALQLALLKLLNSQIIAFTLVLSEPARLRLICTSVRRTLMVMLPEVRRHRAAYTLQKRNIRSLQALGFRLYDQQDKLLLFLPFSEMAEINQVKVVLARIVFDCFYVDELKGKSFIKYHEPAP